jgi:hypothetical protein
MLEFKMPFVGVGVTWTRVITGGGVGVDIFRFDVAFESLASLGVSFYICIFILYIIYIYIYIYFIYLFK